MLYDSNSKTWQRDALACHAMRVPGRVIFLDGEDAKFVETAKSLGIDPNRLRPVNNDQSIVKEIYKKTGVKAYTMNIFDLVRAQTEECAVIWLDLTQGRLRDGETLEGIRAYMSLGGVLAINLTRRPHTEKEQLQYLKDIYRSAGFKHVEVRKYVGARGVDMVMGLATKDTDTIQTPKCTGMRALRKTKKTTGKYRSRIEKPSPRRLFTKPETPRRLFTKPEAPRRLFTKPETPRMTRTGLIVAAIQAGCDTREKIEPYVNRHGGPNCYAKISPYLAPYHVEHSDPPWTVRKPRCPHPRSLPLARAAPPATCAAVDQWSFCAQALTRLTRAETSKPPCCAP
jgi:hypothetical protein